MGEGEYREQVMHIIVLMPEYRKERIIIKLMENKPISFAAREAEEL